MTFLLRLLRRFSSSTLSSPAAAPTAVASSSLAGISNPNLLKTIDRLFKERDPDKLAARFIAASAFYRFRCRHRIYDVTVRRLASSGRTDAVEAVLEAQKRFSSDFIREGFGIRLISLYGKARMPAHAAATFRGLPDLGCPRTVKSFNALLTALADSDDTEGVATAFVEIPAADAAIVPDIISYNVLVRFFCQRCDFDAALETLDRMEKNGVSPCLITFNTLLYFCYDKKRTCDAEKVWTLMEQKNVEPDSKSYNAKLKWLMSEGRISEATELINKLSITGPKPDTYSYTQLMSGYFQNGKLEEAKQVFLDLKKNDCIPSKDTFEVVIPVLCESGDLDLAFKCCFDSFSRKYFVDASILQTVVEKLVNASRVEEAKKLVELGRKNSYSKKSLQIPSPAKLADTFSSHS